MSDLPEKPKAVPNKVIDLLIGNILQKNGINLENAKGKLSSEQKQVIKELVEDITQQVDAFVNQATSPKKDKK